MLLTAEKWKSLVGESFFKEAKKEAYSLIDTDTKLSIQGYDIDPDALDAARANAELAGVDDQIHFQARDVRNISSHNKYGFIITNPPYGERLEEKKDMPELYKTIGEAFATLPTWSYYIITGYEDAENSIGKKSAKNRKIYNGMLKTYFYSYPGPKPPKRDIREN